MVHRYRNSHPGNRSCRGRYNCYGVHGLTMTKTDKVFMGCVRILQTTAKKTGLTYEQVNVAVFCVIWPAVTVGLVVALAVKRDT